MARRKNVKRIDPRYFLHETTNRGEEELEENIPYPPQPLREWPGTTPQPGWEWQDDEPAQAGRKEDEEELEERMPGVPKDVQQDRDIKGRGLGGKKAQKSAEFQRAHEMALDMAEKSSGPGRDSFDNAYYMYLAQLGFPLGRAEE